MKVFISIVLIINFYFVILGIESLLDNIKTIIKSKKRKKEEKEIIEDGC